MLYFLDLVSQAQSFFRGNIGRKKRQAPGRRAPTFEELTFTDEQRALCNNERTCLYDLAVTGDMEVATTTLRASEESDRVQSLIGKSHKLSEMWPSRMSYSVIKRP